MNTNSIIGAWLQTAPPGPAIRPEPPATMAPSAGQPSDFSAHLLHALEQVNQLQINADHQAQLVATGQCDDLLGAVTAVEKAHLALQLTVAVTNRAVEAYKEISHMQI